MMSKTAARMCMVRYRHIIFFNLRHADTDLWLPMKVIKYLSVDPLARDVMRYKYKGHIQLKIQRVRVTSKSSYQMYSQYIVAESPKKIQ